MSCIFCNSDIIAEGQKYVCEECNSKIEFLKNAKRLDSAVDKMTYAYKRYRGIDYSFDEEKESLGNKMMNYNFQFRSVPEICVALEFEKEGIEYYPNYKIGTYTVDFYLPNNYLILEIDGELYHKKNFDKEYLRERSVMLQVGEKFEIVRLGASDVPNFILDDLVEKMRFVVEMRNHNGHFRNTAYDNYYFQDYFQLKRFENKLQRGKGK